jgi:Cys-tRNA(Pro)/Cys-tRNA(Cys) deacylase
MSMEKTNVMRLLDQAKIAYIPHDYDPEIVDGVGVATALGQNPEAVFKSLICENEKKEHFVFDIPVAQELDLKKAAKAAGSKSMEMIPLKELLPLTGYVHGGCSPIGLKKPFPVYMDETAQLFDNVCISAGKRGYQVELSPLDLQNYTHLVFADLVR